MITRVLLDMVSIVMSILLALAADRWRRQREDRRRAREAARSLMSEIQKNREALQRTLAHHQKDSRNLRELLRTRSEASSEKADAPQNLPEFRTELPALVDAAWRVLLHTEALRLLPLPLVAQLAETYRAQEFLQAWIGRLTDLVTSPLFFQTEHLHRNLQALYSVLANLESLETQQIQAYDAALQDLEGFLNIKPTEVVS